MQDERNKSAAGSTDTFAIPFAINTAGQPVYPYDGRPDGEVRCPVCLDTATYVMASEDEEGVKRSAHFRHDTSTNCRERLYAARLSIHNAARDTVARMLRNGMPLESILTLPDGVPPPTGAVGTEVTLRVDVNGISRAYRPDVFISANPGELPVELEIVLTHAPELVRLIAGALENRNVIAKLDIGELDRLYRAELDGDIGSGETQAEIERFILTNPFEIVSGDEILAWAEEERLAAERARLAVAMAWERDWAWAWELERRRAKVARDRVDREAIQAREHAQERAKQDRINAEWAAKKVEYERIRSTGGAETRAAWKLAMSDGNWLPAYNSARLWLEAEEYLADEGQSERVQEIDAANKAVQLINEKLKVSLNLGTGLYERQRRSRQRRRVWR